MTARKPRRKLLAIAVARGCDQYAPLWPELRPKDDLTLPKEVLGCALLRGPADEETFQSIRCGAMVLSDLGNSLGRIVLAALRAPEPADALFLPGASRLVLETFVRGGSRSPKRTWLRTAYR